MPHIQVIYYAEVSRFIKLCEGQIQEKSKALNLKAHSQV